MENLSRRQLQDLAKRHGIRANAKSEVIRAELAKLAEAHVLPPVEEPDRKVPVIDVGPDIDIGSEVAAGGLHDAIIPVCDTPRRVRARNKWGLAPLTLKTDSGAEFLSPWIAQGSRRKSFFERVMDEKAAEERQQTELDSCEAGVGPELGSQRPGLLDERESEHESEHDLENMDETQGSAHDDPALPMNSDSTAGFVCRRLEDLEPEPEPEPESESESAARVELEDAVFSPRKVLPRTPPGDHLGDVRAFGTVPSRIPIKPMQADPSRRRSGSNPAAQPTPRRSSMCLPATTALAVAPAAPRRVSLSARQTRPLVQAQAQMQGQKPQASRAATDRENMQANGQCEGKRPQFDLGASLAKPVAWALKKGSLNSSKASSTRTPPLQTLVPNGSSSATTCGADHRSRQFKATPFGASGRRKQQTSEARAMTKRNLIQQARTRV